MGSLPWVFIARPPQVRMVLRTSLGVIIVLTLLVISQGSIPKTNTGREVTGDDLNVGDINLASIGHTGMRARVKRNSGNNAEKKKSKKRKKIIKRQRRFNQKKSAKKAGNKKNKKTQTERKQQKRLSRRLRKKKGKKTNGNRRKKEKKEKRLRRNKKRNRKHKNNKNHKLGRQEGICQNLTCLNSLVLTLKLEKDTVRNFLAQEKRIKSKMNLMKSKQNKSTKYDQTALELETRLGNTGNHSSLGPLCLGEYNTTTGRKASEVAHSLEDCNSTIVDACKMHSIVTEENQETLKTCKAKMFEYKEKSTKCQEEPSNCDCWSELEEMVSAIKKCNVAKNIEKALNDDYKNCKKKIRQKGRKRRQRNKIKKKDQQKGKKRRSKKRHGKTGRKGRNGKKGVKRRKAAGKKAKKSVGKKRQGRKGRKRGKEGKAASRKSEKGKKSKSKMRKDKKNEKKRIRKKKGKKTNDDRKEKEKIGKRLIRNKKRNRKQKKNRKSIGRQEGICQNLTCLNSLV